MEHTFGGGIIFWEILYFGEWVTYSVRPEVGNALPVGFVTPDSGAGTGKELAVRGAHGTERNASRTHHHPVRQADLMQIPALRFASYAIICLFLPKSQYHRK